MASTCKRGHEWTPENTHTRANGQRWCRACKSELARAWREANSEKERVRRRAAYERNRDVVIARNAAWRAANPDVKRATDAAHYAEIREVRREAMRTYYARNRETLRERGREYYAKNPEVFERGARKRRALKAAVPSDRPTRSDVVERDGTDCGLCNGPVDLSIQYPDPRSPSLDHVIPISKGGHDTMDNVQLSHLRCNLKKGTRTEAEL